MADADVIVVGAGPAGAATAIHCAAAGLSVIVVEREAFPRDRPGETLHPGVEPLLRQLGVLDRILDAGYLRHPGIWVNWGDRSGFTQYGTDQGQPWLGFQAWRADFDAHLLDRARELGVTVLQPVAVRRPLVRAARVVGVQTDRGPLVARFVVDAAGGGHWLARRLRLALERRTPRLLAWFGYAAGDCPPRDEAPAIVADDSGWTWTARVRPGLYQWTRLALDQDVTEPGGVPRELEALSSWGVRRVADVGWRLVRPAAGAGYFLAGDAAFVLDPASSHGVLKALMCGIMAGHLIAAVLRGDCPEAAAASQYCTWVEDWFERDVRRLTEFYSQLPAPPAWLAGMPERSVPYALTTGP